MDETNIEQVEADAKRKIEMWKQAEESAHEQASIAITATAKATDRLAVVQKELATAEKRIAEINAKIREIFSLTEKK